MPRLFSNMSCGNAEIPPRQPASHPRNVFESNANAAAWIPFPGIFTNLFHPPKKKTKQTRKTWPVWTGIWRAKHHSWYSRSCREQPLLAEQDVLLCKLLCSNLAFPAGLFSPCGLMLSTSPSMAAEPWKWSEEAALPFHCVLSVPSILNPSCHEPRDGDPDPETRT